MPLSVNGDPSSKIPPDASPKVRRIIQHRIDDQGLAAVVFSNNKTDPLLPAQGITSRDLLPHSCHGLIHHGLLKRHCPLRNVEDQIAAGSNLYFFSSLPSQLYCSRIPSRSHYKILFQNTLIPDLYKMKPSRQPL